MKSLLKWKMVLGVLGFCFALTLHTSAQAGPFAYFINDIDASGNYAVKTIDMNSNSIVNAISTGRNRPVDIAVSPNGQRVYLLSIVGGFGVVDIWNDTFTNFFGSTVLAGNTPQNMTISSNGNELYISHENSTGFTIINVSNNSMTPIPGIAFPGTSIYKIISSPNGQFLYVLMGNNQIGYVAKLNATSHSVVGPVMQVIDSTPKDMAISQDGRKIYVTDMGRNSVTIYDPFSYLTSSFPVGESPQAIILSNDRQKIFVVNGGDGNAATPLDNKNSVHIINTSTGNLIRAIRVGTHPKNIALSPNGNWAYVADTDSNTISILNTQSNTLQTVLPARASPIRIVASPVMPPPSTPNSPCGNNLKDLNERCDGTDLGGATCIDFVAYNGGTLGCKTDCSDFDYSACTPAPASQGQQPPGGGGGGGGGGSGGSSSGGCSLTTNADTSSYLGYGFLLALFGILLWRRKINEKL